MKKIAAIFAALLVLCATCSAETTPEPGAAYKTLAADSDAYVVEFPDAFSLELPAAWQEQPIGPEQAEAGVIACFSDGSHFINISRAAETDEYDSIEDYAQTTYENYDPSSINTIGGADFALYVDAQNLAPECATMVSGVGIYIFRFYPTGDAEFAQTILDIMGSFSPTEVDAQ